MTKKEVKKLSAILCCKDLKPFNTFESDSFINLSQKLVNLGANYGRFDVKSVLPSHKYVSNEVNDVYENLMSKLKNKIKNITYFGITTDHWTHNNSSKNYLTITLQYIKSYEIKCRVIATISVKNKTSEATKQKVFEILGKFCQKYEPVFVTDNALKCAFKEYEWIPCSGHNMNLVLKHTFDELKKEENSISSLIETSKELVRYGKKSGINNQLNTTLKQAIETRFDSVVDMLMSIEVNIQQLYELEVNYCQLRSYLSKIDENLLKKNNSNIDCIQKTKRKIIVRKVSEFALFITNKVQIITINKR
jgi:hypothetical protein